MTEPEAAEAETPAPQAKREHSPRLPSHSEQQASRREHLNRWLAILPAIGITIMSLVYASQDNPILFPLLVTALGWLSPFFILFLQSRELRRREAEFRDGSSASDGYSRSERLERELALAGRIQASFLPESLPDLPGWELAAKLIPARETSGDFYDIFSLPNGKMGFLIADVVDKGMGAALFMALCRTYLRVFTLEHGQQPELALRAANRFILRDTASGLYVTTFLGILDLASGSLVYANAGHNPPFMWQVGDERRVTLLRQSGMPIGIAEDAVWRQRTVHLGLGGGLLLYTDGVVEAQSPSGEFFGEERLRKIIGQRPPISASAVQEELLREADEFTEGAPQADDIAVMVILRGR